MFPTISVFSKGDTNLKPYLELLSVLRTEFTNSGIQFQSTRSKNLEPISTLVITIVGSVASHLVIKLIDALVSKKEEKPHDKVHITIVYNKFNYKLPNDKTELLKEIENQNNITN